MRTSWIPIGLTLMFSAAALGHDTEICSEFGGGPGSGTAVFHENDGADMELIIEVEGTEPNASLEITYNDVVIGELGTDGDGNGRVVFRQNPGVGELPLPGEVQALLTGDVLRVGPLGGRMGLIGDLNSDCEIDAFDIEPFILALFFPDLLHVRYPRINRHYSGNVNGDWGLDAFDIEPFLDLLFK